jgi:glycine cleavage system protein P-like pyridoxal-binding family
MAQKSFALRRDANAAAIFGNEGCSAYGFELAQGAGDGGLGEVQALGCLGHTFMPRHFNESFELVQFEQASVFHIIIAIIQSKNIINLVTLYM